jgi:putative hydrolase of the HAD superfamily
MDVALRGLIIDIGGVLAHAWDDKPVAAWETRFRMSRQEIVSAIYSGNDDHVLVSKMSEDDWWAVVRERLVTPDDAEALRAAVEASQVWDDQLVAFLRDIKGTTRTAILSNAWQSQFTRMVTLGLGDLVDHIVLSCDIGVAKPDADAFRITLERLATPHADTLFVDDTPGHVEVARSLGIAGHLHTDATSTIGAIRDFLSLPGA